MVLSRSTRRDSLSTVSSCTVSSCTVSSCTVSSCTVSSCTLSSCTVSSCTVSSGPVSSGPVSCNTVSTRLQLAAGLADCPARRSRRSQQLGRCARPATGVNRRAVARRARTIGAGTAAIITRHSGRLRATPVTDRRGTGTGVDCTVRWQHAVRLGAQ